MEIIEICKAIRDNEFTENVKGNAIIIAREPSGGFAGWMNGGKQTLVALVMAAMHEDEVFRKVLYEAVDADRWWKELEEEGGERLKEAKKVIRKMKATEE